MQDVRTNPLEDARLLRYLLNSATDEEVDEIEARVFEDSGFWDSLRALEMELIRDYERGELTSDWIVLFEKHLLTSDTFAAKVREYRGLADAVKQAVQRQPVVSITLRSWWNSGWFPIACAACLAGLVAVNIEVMRRVGYLEQQLRHTPQVPAVRHENMVEFLLHPGTTRGTGDAVILRVPLNADVVRLNLRGLPTDNEAIYIALLNSIGATELDWTGLVATGKAGAAVVVIPASQLRDAEYLLTLRVGTPNPAVERRYQFTVLRR